jgi:ribose transport system substrate-binding protein
VTRKATKGSPAAQVNGAGSRVPGVTRAASALVEVAERGPGTLSDLARRIDVPKSSMLGICQALVDERLMSMDTEGRYSLGFAILELAESYRHQPPQLTTLGVTVQNTDNVFFRVEIDAISRMASQVGTDVIVLSAEQDMHRQIEQIEALVADGCQALIVDAVDSHAVRDAIRSAVDAGIVVVAVNVGADGAQATVTTDNLQAGRLVAQSIAQRLNRRGTVAVVGGLDVTAVRDRLIGFASTLQGYPEMRMLRPVAGDHSRPGGHKAARRIFAAAPPDAIFAINDPTALGVLDFLVEHKKSTPIFSVDGSAPAVQVIADGGQIVATAAQDPTELGRRAFVAANALFSGNTRVPAQQNLPTRLIDADSVANYEAWR